MGFNYSDSHTISGFGERFCIFFQDTLHGAILLDRINCTALNQNREELVGLDRFE